MVKLELTTINQGTSDPSMVKLVRRCFATTSDPYPTYRMAIDPSDMWNVVIHPKGKKSVLVKLSVFWDWEWGMLVDSDSDDQRFDLRTLHKNRPAELAVNTMCPMTKSNNFDIRCLINERKPFNRCQSKVNIVVAHGVWLRLSTKMFSANNRNSYKNVPKHSLDLPRHLFVKGYVWNRQRNIVASKDKIWGKMPKVPKHLILQRIIVVTKSKCAIVMNWWNNRAYIFKSSAKATTLYLPWQKTPISDLGKLVTSRPIATLSQESIFNYSAKSRTIEFGNCAPYNKFTDGKHQSGEQPITCRSVIM